MSETPEPKIVTDTAPVSPDAVIKTEVVPPKAEPVLEKPQVAPRKMQRPFSHATKEEVKAEPFLASAKVVTLKEEAATVAATKENEKAKEAKDSTDPSKKHLRTVTERAREKKAEKDTTGSKFLSITTHEKIMFAKHLAIMLDSGIPLREALEVMSSQVSSKSLQRMLSVMIRDLSDGFTLSSSLEKFPRVFKPFSVSIIRVGESSGTLPGALKYQGQQMEKAKELEGKIRGALLYPIILLFGSIGIAAYLSFGILPKLLPMFSSLSVSLPPTTRILLAASSFITHQWIVMVVTTVVVVILFIVLMRVYAFKYAVHRMILRMPVFGPMIRAVQVAFFTRILGILLSSGVQIVQAIAVTSVSSSNLVYQKKLKEISERVERGEAITDELEKSPALFPRMTTGMIKVGDRTGHLAQSLMNAAEFCEKEVDEATKTLATLIEPITLLLIGGLVGFIALSIITPIYKITEGIK